MDKRKQKHGRLDRDDEDDDVGIYDDDEDEDMSLNDVDDDDRW